MQVQLSSGNYHIIANGEAFLFSPDSDFTIQTNDNTKIQIKIVIKFEDDPSNEHGIKSDIINDSLVITCINFHGTDTGLKCPAYIADIEGKQVYLMFSSTCYGNKEKKFRSIKYTVFLEK